MGLQDRSRAEPWSKAASLATTAFYKVQNGQRRLAEPGHKLFLSLIQTLTLPPAVRKKVEMASRAYLKPPTKPRLKEHGWKRDLEYFDVYDRFMAAFKADLATAKLALVKGTPHVEEGAGATKVRVGSFVLVNTGGFSEKAMAEVAEVVQKAETLIKSSDLGKVCYGEIQVTNTLSKADVEAFYLIANDELFIRANVKSGHDTVRTVIHELGHRFEHKFLKGRNRDIEKLYQLLDGQEYEHAKKMRDEKPKLGEIWVSPKGEEYSVSRIEAGRAGLKVIMQAKNDPKMQASISLEGFLAARGGARNVDAPSYKGFVTQYAKSGGPAENFAEMFAFYCMSRLPVLQSVPFEELVFGATSGDRIFNARARRVIARWTLG